MTEQLSFLLRPTDSFTSTVEHAQLAEQLGYHSIMCTHIAARDSFTTLGALAQHTERIRLTTNVAPIYHRSPASMAQTDAPHGRRRLGRPVRPGPGYRPPDHHGWVARTGDRQASRGDARVRRGRAGDPGRRATTGRGTAAA